MRKGIHRRGFVLLGLLLCTFVLLVLLSALIEAPAQTAAPADATASHTLTGTVLAPAVLPTHESAPEARGMDTGFLSVAFWACLALVLPLPVAGRDANGRVLRKRRYARSFHPLFKQELACG